MGGDCAESFSEFKVSFQVSGCTPLFLASPPSSCLLPAAEFPLREQQVGVFSCMRGNVTGMSCAVSFWGG